MKRALVALAAGIALAQVPVVAAGLFDDEEARKMIAAERRRVDELNEQGKQVSARIARLEESLKSTALLDLANQIELLKTEIRSLRGQIEVVANNIEGTQKRQRDMYVDLDTRLRRIESTPPPAAGAAAPVAPVAEAGKPGTTPPPAAGAPAPTAAGKPGAAPPGAAGAPAPAAAAAASASGDPAAETRAYESAQNLRRIGNYQGAIIAFQNFVKQYPRSTLASSAQYWIGDSYFNLRDYRLAISSQQALLKADPDSQKVPDALLNIASAQAELGETVAARKTMEDIVQKYPVSDAADKAKRRLAAAR